MKKKYEIIGRTYLSPEDIVEVKETNSWTIARLIIFWFQLKHDCVEVNVRE